MIISEILTQKYDKTLLKASQEKIINFARYVNSKYDTTPLHIKIMAYEIQQWIESETPYNLMIFVPPQHGKSELVSRLLPPYLYGLNPNSKIIFATYNANFAGKFCNEVKRYMTKNEYKKIFPKSILPSAKDKHYTNSAYSFNIVEHEAVHISTSVSGQMTGHSADYIIIDDYIKNAIEAYSPTFNSKASDWFESAVRSRKQNKTKILMTFTRWSPNDLAGKLLELEPHNWKVIKLQAIKTEETTHPLDTRKVGEALYPTKHNIESLLEKQQASPRFFESLYQQNPNKIDGSVLKDSWLHKIDLNEFIEKNGNLTRHKWNFYIDTASTNTNTSDYTAIVAFSEIKKNVYIRGCIRFRADGLECVDKIVNFIKNNGYTSDSTVYVENKNIGGVVIQQLNSKGVRTKPFVYPRIKETRKPALTVNSSKEDKIGSIRFFMELGRIWIITDFTREYNKILFDEINDFPNNKNDDLLDAFAHAVIPTAFDSGSDWESFGLV